MPRRDEPDLTACEAERLPARDILEPNPGGKSRLSTRVCHNRLRTLLAEGRLKMTAREIQLEGGLRASAEPSGRASDRRLYRANVDLHQIQQRSERIDFEVAPRFERLQRSDTGRQDDVARLAHSTSLVSDCADLDEFLLVSPEDRAARLNRNGRAGGRAEIKSKTAL